MKAKFISTVILLLMIGLLKSDATFAGYSILFTPNDEDTDYYDPEVYYCDSSDSDYEEPADEPKHYQNGSMFGAFKIITKPKGADINLYDADMYLSESPTPVYPVVMDESMELREGIPGRTITLMITKKGYKPMKKDIFVPFLYRSQERALDNPTVYRFDLKRDRSNSNVSICFYYSYANRHHRYRHHHNWFGPPSYFPWCPPGFMGWYYPPLPPHYHGPHYGLGYWTPNPPPPPPPHGGGHHGGGQNPHNGPWDGGEGSHGDYPPHHNLPFPPPPENGNTDPSGANIGGTKPIITPQTHTAVQVVHAKPDFNTKPDEGSGTSDIVRVSAGGMQSGNGNTFKPKPAAIVKEKPATVVVSKPNPLGTGSRPAYQETPKPKPQPRTERPSYQETPKPKPEPRTERPSYQEKPQPKPEPRTERPSYQEKPIPKPDREQVNNKPVKKEQPNISKPKPKNEDKQKTDEHSTPHPDDPQKLLKFVKA